MAFELLATSLLGTLLVIAVTRTATAYIQKKKVQNVSDFDDKDDTHMSKTYINGHSEHPNFFSYLSI